MNSSVLPLATGPSTPNPDLSLEELIEFYDARDQFGKGISTWHFPPDRKSLELGFIRLKASRHPEAIYVCSLFPGGLPSDSDQLLEVFRAQGKHPIALFYATTGGNLRESAELGHPGAMAVLADLTEDSESFKWAQKSAQGGDRHGLFMLGHCYMIGRGCPLDRVRAVSLFREAALLGSVDGMRCWGKEGFSEEDPERYFWVGQGSKKDGNWYSFLLDSILQINRLSTSRVNAPVLFMIGQMIKGHETEIRDFKGVDMASIEKVVRLHNECLVNAKKAVFCWMLCARRMGLYKDVARIVGKMVWDGRDSFYLLGLPGRSSIFKSTIQDTAKTN